MNIAGLSCIQRVWSLSYFSSIPQVFLNSGGCEAVVIGSRLYLIKEKSAKFAAANKLPPLRHCALPRTGAAKAILDVAGKATEGISKMEFYIKFNYRIICHFLVLQKPIIFSIMFFPFRLIY